MNGPYSNERPSRPDLESVVACCGQHLNPQSNTLLNDQTVHRYHFPVLNKLYKKTSRPIFQTNFCRGRRPGVSILWGNEAEIFIIASLGENNYLAILVGRNLLCILWGKKF